MERDVIEYLKPKGKNEKFIRLIIAILKKVLQNFYDKF